MVKRHGHPFVFVFLLLCGTTLPWTFALAQSESLHNLFERGKTEFKLGSYRSSLATLDKLDEASRQPGLEQQHAKLEPVIAFYRGANLAALDQKEAAKKEFEAYLASFPAAQLDPGMFPRAVIELFNRTRGETQARKGEAGQGTPPRESAIAADYRSFQGAADQPIESIDERWADGPIRFLMTKAEKEAWHRISDPAERAEFISKFWQKRDPNPLTPENEFRQEIARRIQFADAHFTVGEKRGSETDRGMVLVLLGPPSYIGQRPLKSEEDSIQSARAAPLQEVTFNPDGTKTIRLQPRDGLTAQTLQGTREIWYYRRDRLPKIVRFTEVDFEFITKKGFGTAVLQRDHQALTTLEEAARANIPSAN